MLGFVRQLLAGMLFGTSSGYDAVIIALGPTDIVAGIIAGAFASIAIPIYIEEKNKNVENARSYARGLLTFTSLFLILFGVTLVAFPDIYIKIFAPGFHGSEFKLAENYLRIYALLPLMNGWANLFGAFLRAERMFFQYSIAQFSTNIFLIPTLLIFAPFMKEGAYALSLEIGTGAIGLVAYLYGKNIWGKFPFGKISSDRMKMTFYFAVPLFLSSAVSTINGVVDRAFASNLVTGSISALNYSFTIIGMINGIMTAGIITASLTSISESAITLNKEMIVKKTRMMVESIVKILAPLTAFTIVASDLIVRAIYQRGSFTPESTAITSACLIAYSTMIMTIPLTGILGNIYIAQKKTVRLALISIPMLFINAYLDWILMMPFKQAGIAASSSIVSFLLLFLLIYDLGSEFGMTRFFSIKIILPILTSFTYVIVFLTMFSKIPEIPKYGLEMVLFFLMFSFFGRREIKMIISRFHKT